MGAVSDIGSSLSSGLSNLGSAFSNANTFAPDPSGFSGSEWAARFMGGAAKGLGQGMQNMTQQNAQMRQGGGGGQIQPPQSPQPQVDLSSTIMQNPQGQGPGTGQQSGIPRRGNNLNFYGG